MDKIASDVLMKNTKRRSRVFVARESTASLLLSKNFGRAFGQTSLVQDSEKVIAYN